VSTFLSFGSPFTAATRLVDYLRSSSSLSTYVNTYDINVADNTADRLGSRRRLQANIVAVFDLVFTLAAFLVYFY